MPQPSFALCIPTLNAERHLEELLPALESQTWQPSQVVVVDSSSHDKTVERLRNFGATITTISPEYFDHGGTRYLAASLANDSDFVLFLTQDALPAEPVAFQNLLSAFGDPAVAAAYGRQLPRVNAGPIEAHSRLFNYGCEPEVRSLQDRSRLGVKALFCSDSFAAYRSSALTAVGSFPKRIIASEDHIVVGRLLLAGWAVSYVPTARIYHSHEYRVWEDFVRYFDIGVARSHFKPLFQQFGSAGSHGAAFVTSEIKYLLKHSPRHIPESLLRNFVKLLAYKLGTTEACIPHIFKRRLSMHRRFWDRPLENEAIS